MCDILHPASYFRWVVYFNRTSRVEEERKVVCHAILSLSEGSALTHHLFVQTANCVDSENGRFFVCVSCNPIVDICLSLGKLLIFFLKHPHPKYIIMVIIKFRGKSNINVWKFPCSWCTHSCAQMIVQTHRERQDKQMRHNMLLTSTLKI